jgi:hypothetical protein
MKNNPACFVPFAFSCLYVPECLNISLQVPREWAEQAVMLLVGMRQLVKGCARGRTLEVRPVPGPVTPVVPQVQKHVYSEFQLNA